MTPIEVGARLVAGVLLILANAFFVAIEFALTRVRQYPASEFDEPGLRRAWEMTDELEIYLTACQVGISATSIAVGIVAEPALALLFRPLFGGETLFAAGVGSLAAFGLINLVHLTHGEQTPTYLGVERTKTVCRYCATPLYYYTKLVRPIMDLGDTVAKWTLGLFGIEMTGAWLDDEEDIETRAQLRGRLDTLLARGDLSRERHEEIVGALDAGQIPVESIMVDAEDVVPLSTEDDPETNLDLMRETPHTRYPLVDEDGDFEGIVYVSAVLERLDDIRDGETTLEDVAAPPMTVTSGTSVSDAIDRFQAESQELALVLSSGEFEGLVTATDAFEAFMGELEDPFDEESEAE